MPDPVTGLENGLESGQANSLIPDQVVSRFLNRALERAITVDDLRRLFQRRAPKLFYDYVECGAWSEQTWRENQSDLQQLHFRGRVAKDVSVRSTAAEILGQHATMPVVLSPVGLAGIQYQDGEIHAARAAERFGVPFTLSTMSICSLEDVAAHTSEPFWFQLYFMKDPDFAAGLMARAQAVGIQTLVLTLDSQVLSQRNAEVRNRLSVLPRYTLKHLFDFALHPRWALGMLGTRRRDFGNIVGKVKGVDHVDQVFAWGAKSLKTSLAWTDVRQVRDAWPGKLVVKGIHHPDDAREAVGIGVDGLVVSNHGGRQLDGALSTIRTLPQILTAVQGKASVFMDGGIRSGQDILRATAMGADGLFLGRSWVYGLGAGGEAGVKRMLSILHKELDLTMGLCGLTALEQASREQLHLPAGFLSDEKG